MTIEFEIPIEPRPKQSDRSRVVQTNGGKSWVQHYQPKEVVSHARSLEVLACMHKPATPILGPVSIEIDFWFLPPKSMTQKRRALPLNPKDTKPDLDNLEKQTLDVLQRVGFYANDSQIWRKVTQKLYGDAPKIWVRITTNGEPL